MIQGVIFRDDELEETLNRFTEAAHAIERAHVPPGRYLAASTNQ